VQTGVTRRDTALNPLLLREVFRIAPPKDAASSTGVAELGDAVAVIAVNAIKPGVALSGTQRSATQTMLGENRGQQELQDILGLLKAEAKVTLREVNSAE
jgi:peptidyl-prolyl cis-trans isomerase D